MRAAAIHCSKGENENGRIIHQIVFEARLGKQGKHFTLRYDQSIYVVSLS